MAKRIQGSEQAEALDDLPDDADRALSIVRNKLDDRLSVQYTVNQVIQEATDPRNLSSIFSGKLPFRHLSISHNADSLISLSLHRMATLLLDEPPFLFFFPLVSHSILVLALCLSLCRNVDTSVSNSAHYVFFSCRPRRKRAC